MKHVSCTVFNLTGGLASAPTCVSPFDSPSDRSHSLVHRVDLFRCVRHDHHHSRHPEARNNVDTTIMSNKTRPRDWLWHTLAFGWYRNTQRRTYLDEPTADSLLLCAEMLGTAQGLANTCACAYKIRIRS